MKLLMGILLALGLATAAMAEDAPEIAGIDTWINSAPLTLKSLKGKVVLVDFWAYSCINCVRTLPYVNEWYKRYSSEGLVVIGVHAPEFDFEKDADNVRKAVTRYNITYPVALDNNLVTWELFHNHYWPAHYLIDQNGRIVYSHFGEGEYDVMENHIRTLLGLGTEAKTTKESTQENGKTPETYLGLARAENYSGMPALSTKEVQYYMPVTQLPLHHWTLTGEWKVEGERIISHSHDAALTLHFKGKNVFSVIGVESGAASVEVAEQGGKPHTVTIDGQRLYTLISGNELRESTLTISHITPGVAFYTFTF